MSWRENRQRKRVWYRHYRELANELKALMDAAIEQDRGIATEAILKMFFNLYERRRLHKRKRAAASAWASLELAIRDTGLSAAELRPGGRRSRAVGEFGATSPTGVAKSNQQMADDEAEAERQRAEDLEALRKETSSF